jgi:hypothetical protein
MEYEHALAKLFDLNDKLPLINDPECSLDLIRLTKMIRFLCYGNYVLEWVDENKKLYLFDVPDPSLIKRTVKTTEEMVEWILINS